MKKAVGFLAIILIVGLFVAQAPSPAADKYRLAWSHYTGWEPWQLAEHKGILKKWADKYGIEIELVLINDYVESINLFTAGGFHACVMTNMDALTIPAGGGVDCTALIVGDFSNGNDGIVMKGGDKVTDLKGRELKLVQFSVSHYLLARALELNGMTEKDVKLVNASDADIAAIFASEPKGAAVTWNPPLMQCRNVQGANLVFDSSKIPGEIIDLTVTHSHAPDKFKRALVGAWYDTMKLMSGSGNEAKEAIRYMAKFAGGTEAEFQAQLKTTRMFYDPREAAEFTSGPQLKKTMDYVRTFCYSHGLFPKDAKSKDHIGIQFPDGAVMGDDKNVKLRFDAGFMSKAAKGEL